MSCVTTNTCGCLYPSNTDCVFLKGIDANCLSINNGDLLSDAINKINTAICNFEPNPSGLIYVVESCDSNISVATNPVGDTTTYTICLNGDIINDITNLQTDLSTLSACVQNSVAEVAVTVDAANFGLSVSDTGASGCGRQWTIDYTGTPTTIVDGIIHNDFTLSQTNGNGLPQLLKSLPNFNFINDSNIAVGDEIRFEIIGGFETNAGLGCDTLIVDFDSGGSVGSFTYDKLITFNRSQIFTYRVTGTINVETINGASGNNSYFLQFELFQNDYDNTEYFAFSPSKITIPYQSFSSVGGTELNNLSINLYYNNTSTVSTVNNSIRKFMVEVRKKI